MLTEKNAVYASIAEAIQNDEVIQEAFGRSDLGDFNVIFGESAVLNEGIAGSIFNGAKSLVVGLFKRVIALIKKFYRVVQSYIEKIQDKIHEKMKLAIMKAADQGKFKDATYKWRALKTNANKVYDSITLGFGNSIEEVKMISKITNTAVEEAKRKKIDGKMSEKSLGSKVDYSNSNALLKDFESKLSKTVPGSKKDFLSITAEDVYDIFYAKEKEYTGISSNLLIDIFDAAYDGKKILKRIKETEKEVTKAYNGHISELKKMEVKAGEKSDEAAQGVVRIVMEIVKAFYRLSIKTLSIDSAVTKKKLKECSAVLFRTAGLLGMGRRATAGIKDKLDKAGKKIDKWVAEAGGLEVDDEEPINALGDTYEANADGEEGEIEAVGDDNTVGIIIPEEDDEIGGVGIIGSEADPAVQEPVDPEEEAEKMADEVVEEAFMWMFA